MKTALPDTRFEALRAQAEEAIGLLTQSSLTGQNAPNLDEALHEIRLYQLELEMQNESLRKSQESLSLTQDHLYDLFNLAPVGYLILDKKGLILNVNATSAQQLGRPQDEILGTDFTRFIALNQRDSFYIYLRQVFRSDQPRREHFQILCQDDSLLEVYLDSLQIKSENGSDKCCRMTVSDITAFKQAEAEKALLQAQLSQKHRLESIGTMAASISHDFSHLLTAILGNLELAMDNMPPESPAQDYLRNIHLASFSAIQLLQQMKFFSSRYDPGHTPLDLSALLQEMVPLMEVTLPKGTQLDCQLDPALPLVSANEGQMRQVMMNLIANAAEALNSGNPGEILLQTYTVQITPKTLKQLPLNRPLPRGRYVCVEVADNGQGIDPTIQSKLFEPFFTTKGKGHGLGLSIVHTIVHDHQGAISLVSQPGTGTTLSILLPAQVP